jgi:hypothetical protein
MPRVKERLSSQLLNEFGNGFDPVTLLAQPLNEGTSYDDTSTVTASRCVGFMIRYAETYQERIFQ